MQRMFVRSLTMTACVLIALLSCMLTLETKVAHAATILTCLGNEFVTYDPGITNTPRVISINVTSHLDGCAGLPLGVRSGEGSATFTSMQACKELPGTDNVSYRQAIIWGNGYMSIINWTRVSISAVDGTATITQTGTVIAGLYARSTATATTTLPNTHPLACTTFTGVTSEGGPMMLELT
jgi:hypothetical protein